MNYVRDVLPHQAINYEGEHHLAPAHSVNPSSRSSIILIYC